MLNLGIEKYRGEKDVGNYVAAAGAAGAIAGLTKGPKAGAQGMLAAGICGLAFGSMIQGLEHVQGTLKDELQQQKEQEQQTVGGSGNSINGNDSPDVYGGVQSPSAHLPAKPWVAAVKRQQDEASTSQATENM